MTEFVVLLDEDGTKRGTAPKSTVHAGNTPLHLAFSCYLLSPAGDLLVTRRSLMKKTWPGVWTNSFCGHPGPEEEFHDAIERRARFELGASVADITVVLPHFRYSATDASGVVENEVCPVFTATLDGSFAPNTDEVAEWAWVAPSELNQAVRATPFAFSPWLVSQLDQLLALGLLATEDQS